ncbi:MAG: hypothetical protein KGS72_19245 [Cyanobacteria bacterium REEB67]|nr:hypothetical protein [Cyanobacteria bacterium REEB67]
MQEPAIQIHPMVPLAKASAILKISRDELIRRLTAGELLGEKRRIGESKKDNWFIYADEFDRLLAQALAKYEERISTRGMDHLFNPPKAAYAADWRQPVAASPEVTPQAVLPKMVVPELKVASEPENKSEEKDAEEKDETILDFSTETIEIQPVSMDPRESDPGEIIDAIGTNYALGGDYEDDDAGIASEVGTGLQVSQAMVTQLVHHFQEERQRSEAFSEALKVRLSVLEEEVDQLRRELLARPDRQSHSPLTHIKNYFRLLLGKST